MSSDRQKTMKWIWGIVGLAAVAVAFHYHNRSEPTVTQEPSSQQLLLTTSAGAGNVGQDTMVPPPQWPTQPLLGQETHPAAMMQAGREIDQVFSTMGPGAPDSEAVYHLVQTMLVLAPGEQDNLFLVASGKYPQRGNEVTILWAFDHMLNGNCPRALVDLRRVSPPSDDFWKDIVRQIQGCNNGAKTG